jgi:hypothetical protein
MDPEIVPAPAPVMEIPPPAPEETPAVPNEVSPAPVEDAVKVEDISSSVLPEAVPAERNYPSLYDSTGTTVVAIILGISIVAAIQYAIIRMYSTAKSEQIYLTRFVTSLVGLVMGAYIADLLIAGPDTSLLTDEEHTMILGFVKDIALMIFAYYFGTKSSSKTEEE